MRLIDADKLREVFVRARELVIKNQGGITSGTAHNMQVVINEIDRSETVDAEQVRHGLWVENEKEYSFRVMRDRCSICGSTQGIDWMNFCPNCGAKMDGGAENA